MIQVGNRLCFGFKALLASWILRELLGQNLDGDTVFSSGIQDSVSSTFEKFDDFRHLLRLDTHFKKGFTEVINKPIEMPVVKPLIPCTRMSSMHILARIHNSPAEEHGNKHALSCA